MAKNVQPHIINPLIVGFVSGAVPDTIHQVNHVLGFVASVMQELDDSDGVLQITGAANGLSLVLLTCRAALQFHVDEGGCND